MQRIGKYQIQSVVGRGGMGTVYEAIDPLINRKIALKTMIQGLGENPELRLRFLREAQAAGGLRHRNIVTVYDLGEDKGQPYIAMEYIEGTDLERVISKKEPYPIEWKIDVIHQICDGLGYAHRNGIVHRDVKPANIRVTPEGEVKIMDFGIAHFQSSSMTRSGLVMGTVHYMSPEQIDGHKVDHRADIFSVGAIAYELLAYRRPFDGDSLTAVMFKITHEDPDPKALPRTDYSPGLEAIIQKALVRDVLQRYQSLDQMLEDLEQLVRETAPKLLKRPDPTRALLEEARSARAEGKLDLALEKAREAARRTPSPEVVGFLEEVMNEGRLQRAAALVASGRELLGKGEPAEAIARAREALALTPDDGAALALVRRAEGDMLGRRVEREMGEIRAEMQRARTEGHLQKALNLSRRLVELDPDNPDLTRAASEIEAVIQDREVEQLCKLALTYAADGDVVLSQKIAAKIERMAPQNPRYLTLKNYISEENEKREAESCVARARDLLAAGQLVEAHTAVEEALRLRPNLTAALEIKSAVTRVLPIAEKKRPQESEEVPAVPEPKTRAAPAEQATVAIPSPSNAARLTPLPQAAPKSPEAAAHLEAARLLLKERQIEKALASLEEAARIEPDHPLIQKLLAQTKAEARRAEVEFLTTAALNHFVQNDHKKARKAVDKALGLDPDNRRARELLKVLGTLG